MTLASITENVKNDTVKKVTQISSKGNPSSITDMVHFCACVLPVPLLAFLELDIFVSMCPGDLLRLPEAPCWCVFGDWPHRVAWNLIAVAG